MNVINLTTYINGEVAESIIETPRTAKEIIQEIERNDRSFIAINELTYVLKSTVIALEQAA